MDFMEIENRNIETSIMEIENLNIQQNIFRFIRNVHEPTNMGFQFVLLLISWIISGQTQIGMNLGHEADHCEDPKEAI